ncbi:MAG: hypothetical protein N2510_04960 [Ignavibacteria bacterium]|nr:hypothetical protein [Ignavibacteria bacterium]
MNKKQFLESVKCSSPPHGLHPLLTALWHDAKGEWHKAHEIVQSMNSDYAARIHAYLHRKEGDIINAEYWYNKAGQKMPELTHEFELEWIEILDDLLEII